MLVEDITITRWPVLIVGAPRTGSNVLTDTLSKKYNARWFYEPGKTPERLTEFVEFRKTNDPHYIAKIFLNQKLGNEVYNELFASDCFKIKLTRASEVDQVLSFYIALMSEVWDETDRVFTEYIVPINVERINYSINQIREDNKLLKELGIQFDLELTYEEMGVVSNTELVKTTLPLNYDRVRQAVIALYNQKARNE